MFAVQVYANRKAKTLGYFPRFFDTQVKRDFSLYETRIVSDVPRASRVNTVYWIAIDVII